VDHLRETVKGDHIPDYRFELEDDFVSVYHRAVEAAECEIRVGV
jgi:hypothetical protein